MSCRLIGKPRHFDCRIPRSNRGETIFKERKKVSMKKPVKKYPLEKIYAYNEVITYIENKHGIKTRDYANSSSQFDEWCDSKGYGKKDSGGITRSNSIMFYDEYKEDIEKGLVKERPHLDFWHWVIDFNDSISNGSIGRIYDLDTRITGTVDTPEFVRKILTLIVGEGFANEENEFEFWAEW